MKTYIQKLILCLALVVPFTVANGSVSLTFAEGPTISVASGGTFTLTLNLVVTAGEPVVAVDYYLQELSAAGFTIISRNITGSVFPDVYFSPTQVASPGDDQTPPGDTDLGPDNALNPRNDRDLGGTTQFADDTTGSGFVASFLIGAPTAPGGSQFTISTFSLPNNGWVSPSNTNPHDHLFDSQASILITIIPEPATWSLLGLGALSAFGLNLLRARARR